MLSARPGMTLGRPFNSRTFLNSPSTLRRSGSSCLKLIYGSDLSTRQTTPTGTMSSATPRDLRVPSSRLVVVWQKLGLLRQRAGSRGLRTAHGGGEGEGCVHGPPLRRQNRRQRLRQRRGQAPRIRMASGEMTREEFRPVLGDVALTCAPPGAIIYACVKTNGGMGSLYRLRHELVFVFRNGSSLKQHSTR
jgi:hypothetical protein